MKTNKHTLNKLSNLIMELELEEFSLSAEMDEILYRHENDMDILDDMDENEYIERREHTLELQKELDRIRKIILDALDEWNEKFLKMITSEKVRDIISRVKIDIDKRLT